MSTLPASQLHLSTPIVSAKPIHVFNNGEKTHRAEITTASGETLTFDEVVLACHTDTTVDVLKAGGGMSPEETRILEAFKWNKNEAVLHCDERVGHIVIGSEVVR